MRKTNKRADGTEEVLEGDPEELRKYEDLQKPQEQAPITESPKKPGILHGAEVDGIPLTESEKEWVRFLRNFPKYEQTLKPLETKPVEWPGVGQPIWITYCSTCRRIDCYGNCWAQFQPWITYTYGTSTPPEKVRLLWQDDGSSRFSHSLSDILMGRAAFEVKTNGN